MTPYHSQYWAHLLTLKGAGGTIENLTRSISNARVDLNPHQIDAALFALRSPLSKGAILADEVGLGKTIEAGIVLSQRWAERKRRILLIVPATLRKQWQQELDEKFYLPSLVLDGGMFNRLRKQGETNPFMQNDKIVICSYHFISAKAPSVQGVPWDLVVIDEAHRLRNVFKPQSKMARRIADSIGPAHKLLLTATPLQNSLMELYGLVSIIDEHVFGDAASFRDQFVRAGSEAERNSQLRNRLNPVCIRTLRKQVVEYVSYTKRIPITQDFTPSDDEHQLYESVSAFLQRENLVSLPASQRHLITLVLRKLTNLYTIVPLRKADSRTLVEQSIGRGLRLPYGKRTGNAAVDRLTIVAHDKFQEIVDEANRGDSILVTGVVIGKDIPEKKSKVVEVVPKAVQVITGQTGTGSDTTKQKPLFTDKREVEVATTTLDIIKQEFERLPRSSDLNSPEVRKELVAKVKEKIKVPQAQLEGMEDKLEDKRVEEVIKETTETYVAMTIDIPRITLVPTGDRTCGYKDFDLDTGSINQQPMANNILIQTLRENKQTRLLSLASDTEKKLEDYLVRGLIDYNDISYDDDSKLLYKLSGQLIDKLRTYLTDEADIRNVLLAYNPQYVRLIHAQMQDHFVEEATDYEVHVSAGFNVLRMSAFNAPEDETPRPFRQPVDEKKNIRSMLFGDFDKCLFPVQKFDSDTERRFTVILENDESVTKWVKPNKGTFQIHYSGEANYEPDFVAETKDAYYLCEPKAEPELEDEVVQAKAKAAAEWCKHASTVAAKPWHYLLIPHTAVQESKSLASLAAQYTVQGD